MAELITAHRDQIEQRSRERFLASSVPKPTEAELERGIPILIDQLLAVLGRGAHVVPELEIERAAMDYGARLFALGFTLSELVHGYGALCEAVTGVADELDAQLSPREFETLNRVLDVAIASAVTEYDRRGKQVSARKEAEHMGVLAHELRNALSSASMAFDAMKRGTVGVTGRTADVLSRCLVRMAYVLDHAFVEARLDADAAPVPERLRVADVLDDVGAMMQREAERRSQRLEIDVDHALEVDTDRQLLVSALSNLVQNGLKYTHERGRILVRGYGTDGRVVIEVEDECGGLPQGRGQDLFAPFVRGTTRAPGLGLGLSIVRRAVKVLKGDVWVRDLPGKGCVFTIELPRR